MHGNSKMTEEQFTGNLYQRFPVTIERGFGSHVWDVNGKEFIDCMGGYGVALVGHRNERVVNAIKSQLEKIITVHSSLYNKTREKFLENLISIAPKSLSQVHLNNSGAEAIEAAIKFARKFTQKKGMIAMNGSYHGKSMGALSLTFNPKYRKEFEPLVEKVSFSPFGDIDALRSKIDDDTGFVILEPIQGESGIHVAPDGFLQDVIIQNAENMGKKFRDGLELLKNKHKIIREIRAKGLMIGIELKFEVKDILMDGIEKGVLLLYSGRNIIRLLPPLVISEDDITKVLETLDILFSAEEKRNHV